MALATPVVKRAQLIAPYGGRLVNLLVSDDEREELKAYATHLPSIQLSMRSICDLELMAVGAFSPLDRFMGKRDYKCVLNESRLANGQIFPIPITLPVDATPDFGIGDEIALRDLKNNLLALMEIHEIYEWNMAHEARMLFGSTDLRHPYISEMHRMGKVNISGLLRVFQLPRHHDFRELRFTPAETRERLESLGHSNVVAFQTRNPLHRAHEELTKRAVQEIDGSLLLHPVVGLTKPGDVDHYTRVRTYRTLTERYYQPDRAMLALLPLAMRMAGPREAVWHMLIRRNYGANHMIIGRDHAGPGNDSTGKPFFCPYDAQEIAHLYSKELGVKVMPFQRLVYLPEEDRYEEESKIQQTTRIASISGTQVREDYLHNGKKLPTWFTRPEVAEILAESYPPRHKQGVCIWFTGLSGSGKSTTADVLTVLLQQHGRQISELDGDVVRTHLSKGLGFSKEDRDINIRRIGYVASEIVRHGGVVICAAVSPYRATRSDVRNMVGSEHFVEIFVNTPIEVCEDRDVKGMYAMARRGEIKGFTGIDDPYEEPLQPELILNTVNHTPEENAHLVIHYLFEQGFLRE